MPCYYPPHPNLQQLKHQAKDLRKAHAAGDAESMKRIREFLPRCAQASDEELRAGNFTLQEAQHVIANEYGFKHWKMLCVVVEANLDILFSLNDEEIKELLRVIDLRDFTRAIKTGDVLVSERFLSNMSRRVRTFITEEVEFIGEPLAEEATAVRRQILSKATELAAQGKIEWPDKKNADLAKMQKAIEAEDIEPMPRNASSWQGERARIECAESGRLKPREKRRPERLVRGEKSLSSRRLHKGIPFVHT